MSELMAQYEQIALLEREAAVQGELIEALYDRVAYLEETVLSLDSAKGVSRVINRQRRGPPDPSLPLEEEHDA